MSHLQTAVGDPGVKIKCLTLQFEEGTSEHKTTLPPCYPLVFLLSTPLSSGPNVEGKLSSWPVCLLSAVINKGICLVSNVQLDGF